MPEKKLLAGLQSGVLSTDIVLDGKVIAKAGDTIILVPQTLAECVITANGISLAELLPTFSKVGHGHESLTAFAAELVRLSTRQTDSEEALIAYSAALVKQSNSITDARISIETLATQIGYHSASTIAVITDPQFDFEAQTENTGEEISFAVSADSLLKNGAIDHFLLTIPELSIADRQFKATSNAAQVKFTPFGYMSSQKLSIAVCAVDSYGNRSRATLKTTTLVIYGIQPPTITAPLEGATVDSLTPTLVMEPMQVIGDLTDTAKYVRVQIAKDSQFQEMAFDNGIESAPTEDNTVDIFEGLEAGKTYFARARWTGEFLGNSPWSRTVTFKTEAGE